MDNVIILYGGESVERDISVITAIQVMESIDTQQHAVHPIYMLGNEMFLVRQAEAKQMNIYADTTATSIDKKLMQRCIIVDGILYLLKKNKLKQFCDIDCAVVCCHGGSGENGELQGLLEMNKIPYTCAGVKASAMCMDKALSHKIANRINIKNTKFVLIDVYENYDAEKIFATFSGELGLIVKPNALGSSIGIGVAFTVDELKECIITASLYDNNVIIESKVNNLLEFNCACLKTSNGILVSGVDCPIANSEILSFNDKYIEGSKYIIPNKNKDVEMDIALINKITAYTERLYKEMDLFGVVRIDYLYDTEKDVVYFNEINTIPGSMAYYLFDSVGYSMRDLISEMIAMAYKRHAEGQRLIKQFTSSVLNRNAKSMGKLLQK